MKPFGKEKEVFISHSSKDKTEVENLLPYINGMDLPIWFDKYNIDVGQSIVEKVQEGVKNSYAVIFWVTDNFLQSKWCKREMQAFIKRMIEEETLIVTILDENVAISSLPIFLQDIKCISRKEYSFDDIAKELSHVFKKNFCI